MDTVHHSTGDIEVSFKIKNTGSVSGKETPLLFVRDCVSSVVTPQNLLKEFTKVELAPDEEQIIRFQIPVSSLGLWNKDMNYVVEPGEFIFSIGRSLSDIRVKPNIRIQDTN